MSPLQAKRERRGGGARARQRGLLLSPVTVLRVYRWVGLCAGSLPALPGVANFREQWCLNCLDPAVRLRLILFPGCKTLQRQQKPGPFSPRHASVTAVLAVLLHLGSLHLGQVPKHLVVIRVLPGLPSLRCGRLSSACQQAQVQAGAQVFGEGGIPPPSPVFAAIDLTQRQACACV